MREYNPNGYFSRHLLNHNMVQDVWDEIPDGEELSNKRKVTDNIDSNDRVPSAYDSSRQRATELKLYEVLDLF